MNPLALAIFVLAAAFLRTLTFPWVEPWLRRSVPALATVPTPWLVLITWLGWMAAAGILLVAVRVVL